MTTREKGQTLRRSRRAEDRLDQRSTGSEADTTKHRILAAAEELLANHGVDGTSLRAVTERAGVNLAAVNYHFGSKEALILAVFDHLAERVNNRRLSELNHVMSVASADGRDPYLKDVIVCFIRPYVDPLPDENSLLLAQLVLQHRIAPSAVTKEIIGRHFDPMATRFIEALSRCCKGVDEASIYWRYMFMAGAVVMTATDHEKNNRLARLSGGSANMCDRQAAFDELLRFLIGAMGAP